MVGRGIVFFLMNGRFQRGVAFSLGVQRQGERPKGGWQS